MLAKATGWLWSPFMVAPMFAPPRLLIAGLIGSFKDLPWSKAQHCVAAGIILGLFISATVVATSILQSFTHH